MRTIIVILGVSFLCVLAPVSSNAKTDHAKCEDRCHAYYCHGGASRQLYCNHQCESRCNSKNQTRSVDRHHMPG
jgi:hypothetical protein